MIYIIESEKLFIRTYIPCDLMSAANHHNKVNRSHWMCAHLHTYVCTGNGKCVGDSWTPLHFVGKHYSQRSANSTENIKSMLHDTDCYKVPA